MNFIYKVVFLQVLFMSFLIACSSDTQQDTAATQLAANKGTSEKITPENWQPKTSAKVIDSLKKNLKRMPNQKFNVPPLNLDKLPEAELQQKAAELANAHCKCQQMPLPEGGSSQERLQREQKNACNKAVNELLLKMNVNIKDMARKKMFLDTYENGAKKCK